MPRTLYLIATRKNYIVNPWGSSAKKKQRILEDRKKSINNLIKIILHKLSMQFNSVPWKIRVSERSLPAGLNRTRFTFAFSRFVDNITSSSKALLSGRIGLFFFVIIKSLFVPNLWHPTIICSSYVQLQAKVIDVREAHKGIKFAICIISNTAVVVQICPRNTTSLAWRSHESQTFFFGQ